MVLTRADISDGYQLVQSTHSVANFAAEHPNTFKNWKTESDSIICLSVKDEESLLKYYDKLNLRTDVSLFWEPDVNAYTSLCIYGTSQIRKKLSHLPLALKNSGEYSSVVEQGSLKPKVVGSNPAILTMSNNLNSKS